MKTLPLVALLCIMSLVVAACGVPTEPYVSYQPLGFPVTFVVTTAGIEIEAGGSVVTPIGVFSLGAKFPVDSQQSGDLLLILRDLTTSKDTAFQIKGGQSATIVADGQVIVEVSSSEIVVDVTNAHTVQVNPPASGVARWMAPSRPGPITIPDCPGAFPSRLAVGATARAVQFQVKVYSNPSANSPLAQYKYLREGRTVTILNGPVCNGGMVWWEVDSGVITLSNGRRDNVRGWVPEESGDDWLLSP